MAVAAAIDTPDLGASLHRFLNAAQAFFTSIADIAWGYLAAALLLSLALQLARAHGWANALRAAYPRSRVSETRIAAAFLVGAGMNGILPARGGDALKIVLAKRGVERSSYPTIVSSFAALAPFDTAMGLLVLLYAITQGLLPRPPRFPHLPAFEITFWAAHPRSAAAAAHADRDRGLRPDRDPVPSGRVLLAARQAGPGDLPRARPIRPRGGGLAAGRLALPLRLVLALPRGFPHRRLGPERALGDERPVDQRRAAVHPGRSRRAAGAPRGHARRSLARRGPLLLRRPAARGHRLVRADRVRSAPLRLSNQGLALLDPRGRSRQGRGQRQ